MKRLIWILLLTVLLALPVGAAEAVPDGAGNSMLEGLEGWIDGFGEMSVEDWKAFIDETVVPVVMMVVTAIATIYVAISPILFKVKTASQKFHKATDDVNAASSDVAQVKLATAKAAEEFNARYELIKQENLELRRDMVEQMERFRENVTSQVTSLTDTVNDRVGTANKKAQEIEQMLLIGLCNNRELVERGHAHEIARIAQGMDSSDVAATVAAVEAEDADGEEVKDDGEQVEETA